VDIALHICIAYETESLLMFLLKEEKGPKSRVLTLNAQPLFWAEKNIAAAIAGANHRTTALLISAKELAITNLDFVVLTSIGKIKDCQLTSQSKNIKNGVPTLVDMMDVNASDMLMVIAQDILRS